MEWYTLPVSSKREIEKRSRLLKRVRRVLVVLIVVLLLTAGGASGWYAWAKMEVTVADDGEILKVTALGGTVAEVLEREGVQIEPWDQVSPSPESQLYDGIQISIQRAVPVTVRLDGRELDVWTVAQSVDRALADAGIELGADDLVLPARQAPVTRGMEIGVIRVTTEIEEREVSTPYAVVRRPAYDMLKGQTRVLTRGAEGLVRETWQVCYHDGDEFSRELVQSEVLSKPRNQVLLVGTADTVTRGAQEIRFERTFAAEVTAYTYTGNNTFTGEPPGPGTVAVDPRVIPLGTRLYIDGYGYGRAMDIGSAIKGHRVDVFFPTRQEAVQWGRRTVNVYILE